MGIKLTSEEILEKIQRAFAPFHVVAELQDYHREIGFRVYGENHEIVGTYEGALVEELRNPANLKQLIMDTRSDIHNKDRKLNPWSFEA
jgi:N-formylglutamate amidohydrolase